MLIPPLNAFDKQSVFGLYHLFPYNTTEKDIIPHRILWNQL